MANFLWNFDAPSGVFKNHALSSEIRKASIATTKFMQFVRAESAFGKKRGENVSISRISNLTVPTDGRISEGQKIPEDDISLSSKSITVSEFGRAVPYTSLSEDLNAFDMNNIVQMALRDQMALTLDNACAAVFTGSDAKVKAIPTGVSAITFDTDGTASSAATVNLNVFHVEEIRDKMFGDLKIPPVEGDDYICILSTKAKRGIVSDPAWEEWHKYTDPKAKYNGEIGRLENIRFIETNNSGALSGTLGTGSVLGEAVFFGRDAVAMALVEDPELRAEMPKDFGRQKSVAWYGILDFGVVWDTANEGEAKIVHVSSS